MFIKECDKNDDLIEPKMRDDWSRIWSRCLEDSSQHNGRVDWKLVEMGMFGRYNNSSSSVGCNVNINSYIGFPYSFPRQLIFMANTSSACFIGRVKTNIYVFKYAARVELFCKRLFILTIGDEYGILLEHCTYGRNPFWWCCGGTKHKIFYMYTSVIFYMGVGIPFTMFEFEVLQTDNGAPPNYIIIVGPL